MRLRAHALLLMVAWPVVVPALTVWYWGEDLYRYLWNSDSYVHFKWRSTYGLLWQVLRTGKQIEP